MEDIEKVMAENMVPQNRTSIDDCGKCTLYDFADVCRCVACTDSNNSMSVFWTIDNINVINRLRNESAKRVFAASKAILSKQR